MKRSLFLLALSAVASGAVLAQTTGVVTQTPDAVQTPDAATSAPPAREAGSAIRIVRLSQARGKVELDRNNRGYEEAFTNLPIVQGARLKTDEGVAEVEFEDNSALRLTPNTIVEFPHLRLLPSGATVSQIRVLQGMVYVSLNGSKTNTYTLLSGNSTIELAPSAHVELEVAATGNKLAVLDGSAEFAAGLGQTATPVGKKHSLLFNTPGASENAAPELVAKVDKAPFDEWDKNATDYHHHYSNASAFGGGGASYGISDLNYYGSFADLPGCGNVWRPYFASASFDPFANGTWAFYQGAGYSWVSPYPWAWTPFHSGAWQQCGTSGWGWRPGGSFVTLLNSEKLPPPSLLSGRPHVPRAPAPGQPGLVPVNLHPVAISGHTDAQTFVFSKDSAGLGVPRQTFGKLGSVSKDVVQHGAFATTVTPSTGIAQSLSQRQQVTYDRHESAVVSPRSGTNQAPASGKASSAPSGAAASSHSSGSTASSSSHSSASSSAPAVSAPSAGSRR